MKVLAIESTCDETAASVVESFGGGVKVISSIVASSVEIHSKYGGIIPEIAAREQIKSIVPVILEATKDSPLIDAIAVTYGPGLMGSLLVGVETAKSLAWAWKKPLIEVNHMVAHVMANWIINNNDELLPELPAIALIISGGHTDFVHIKNINDWKLVGGTRDDAIGEAFDKVARLLDFPYPGGPEIDKASQRVNDDDWKSFVKTNKMPRPLINDNSLEMSFSGLKAAVSRLITEEKVLNIHNKDLIAREFSEAVSEVLVSKLNKAIEKYQPKSVIIAGGVAANGKLRENLRTETESHTGIKFFVPQIKYCGDNAAMVGATAIMIPNTANPNLSPNPSLEIV